MSAAAVGPTPTAGPVRLGVDEAIQVWGDNCEALIAEAFNVHTETGLTPRQLAEQRAELLAALVEAEKIVRNCVSAGQIGDGYLSHADDFRAAIAKCSATGATK